MIEPKYVVKSCALQEGVGQLEVFLEVNNVDLQITYFLLYDSDEWASTLAYDPDGNLRDDLLSLEEIYAILDSPDVKPYKSELEDYKKAKRGPYSYDM
ncbi:hypothetical protein AV540_07675 [Brevibacillus parabrevis]|uniref:hypothetical protein n=1 Tax=Brevibacillus parabrevis TaxID=54914 RepID=UPI0007ABB85E|nr:hypothetical protein [Brevibacillus parabrevis]KZE54092.1 hypothetical protein AV540_07675 [Brevibacillus parabrevis]